MAHCEGCRLSAAKLSPSPLCLGASPGQEKACSGHTAGLRHELTGFLMACCKASSCLPLRLEGPRAACHLLWPFGLMRSEWGHRDNTLHTHPGMDPTELLRGQAAPPASPTAPHPTSPPAPANTIYLPFFPSPLPSSPSSYIT